MIKRTFIILFSLLSFASCGDRHQTPPPTVDPGKEEPEEPTGEWEKMLWMDADESFATSFSTPEKITALLDKIKDTGFNKIVVDVRPVEGTVLYDSSFMPSYGDSDTQGYDYLQFMIDEARKRDMKVTVSAVIFGAGFMKDAVRNPAVGRSRGVAWSDPALAKLACVEYVAGRGLMNTMDDTQAAKNSRQKGAGGFIFLNPAHPDAQDYALRFVEEIVTKYDFDAFALDYCRFPDAESDFSDFSRGEFERFIGRSVGNWPGDIFTYNPDGSHIKGTYYYDWWRWRATVVHDVVGRIRSKIKEIKPSVKLEYWAASWLSKDSGQNWASPLYDLSTDGEDGWYYRDWMTAEYSRTGFADHLDTFLIGTYMTNTYMAGSAAPKETMEYQLARGQRYVGRAARVYGNVAGTNTAATVEEQIYYCLTRSDGLMVFDVSHFINDTAKWAAFKRGIERAEKEAGTPAAN